MLRLKILFVMAIGFFVLVPGNAKAEYVDGMSQYRGYFVPGGEDPMGLCKQDPEPMTDEECCQAFRNQNGGQDFIDAAPPNGPTGLLICCNGKKVGCVFRGSVTGITNATAFKIASDCIQVHEDRHKEDSQDCDEERGIYGVNFKMKWINFRKKIAETRAQAEGRVERAAYKVQLNCLRLGLKECKGDVECQEQIETEMDWIENRIAEYSRGPWIYEKPSFLGDSGERALDTFEGTPNNHNSIFPSF